MQALYTEQWNALDLIAERIRALGACDGKENAFFAGVVHQDVAALHVQIDNVSYAPGETIYRLDRITAETTATLLADG